jgi:hypothetical protein
MMRINRFKLKLAFNFLGIFVGWAIFAVSSQAQTVQKFVSARNGNDSGSCTLKLPCRTFAAAILQVPPRGEIIALDSGDYGTVTIEKSVTIAGPVGDFAEIRVGMGPAVTVDAGASGIVVLRGLTITGSPLGPNAPGILFQTGAALLIEHCVINGISGNGVSFAGNGQLFLSDTVVRNCALAGVSIGAGDGPMRVSVDRCRFENNGSDGIGAAGNANVTIRDSVAAGNRGTGFATLASGREPTQMNLENCVSTGNRLGVFSSAGIVGGTAILRVSNSTITGNDRGVIATEGGSILSRRNNTVEGNNEDGAFTGTFVAK